MTDPTTHDHRASRLMRGRAFALALCCAAALGLGALTPTFAAAQEEGGSSLMERGAELFWEGLRQEMAPAIDDLKALAEGLGPSLQSFLSEMGPALADIASEIEDWSVYERPEILPNGDIIIRRKPDTQPDTIPPQDNGSSATTDI
ncbi:hypothetical protein [Phaeobacter sp.]|uniref:hypothetical protein n=1 Tax=Phaeobacter sp. TaxID=1902409 RepID=UPI0025D439A7|nr:hypothetical protein [Phaeobacter sp.]